MTQVASWESGKLIPPMVGMGEEATGKVSQAGVGEGEQRVTEDNLVGGIPHSNCHLTPGANWEL